MLVKTLIIAIVLAILPSYQNGTVYARTHIFGQRIRQIHRVPDQVRIFEMPVGVPIDAFVNVGFAHFPWGAGSSPSGAGIFINTITNVTWNAAPSISSGNMAVISAQSHTAGTFLVFQPSEAVPRINLHVRAVSGGTLIPLTEHITDGSRWFYRDPVTGFIQLDFPPPFGPQSEDWINDAPRVNWTNNHATLLEVAWRSDRNLTGFMPSGRTVPLAVGLNNLSMTRFSPTATIENTVEVPGQFIIHFNDDSAQLGATLGQINTPNNGHRQSTGTVIVSGAVAPASGDIGRIRIEHPSSGSFRDVSIQPHMGMFTNTITLLGWDEYHILLQVGKDNQWRTIDTHIIHIERPVTLPPGTPPDAPPPPVDPTLPPDRDQFSDNILGEMQHMIATISFWLTYPFRVIAAIGQQVVEIISSAYIDGVGTLATMMQIFYLVMPEPIGNAIVLLINVTVLVAVIRMVRG